jgi:hypothetical protein
MGDKFLIFFAPILLLSNQTLYLILLREMAFTIVIEKRASSEQEKKQFLKLNS